MINLSNTNISHSFYPGIDLTGIRLGVGSKAGGVPPQPISPIPGLEGIIGLYIAKGLTNDQMKENPVWKDKSGLGNDLQMMNFDWAGMSGVNGYSESFSKAVVNTESQINSNKKITIAGGNTSGVSVMYNASKFSSYIKVTGLEANTDTSSGLYIYNSTNGFSSAVKYTTDGIYKVDVSNESDLGKVYIWGRGRQSTTVIYDTPITVELIPLYSGAIVFDGVDDYGICETFPILTKEKGYTVMALRKYITDPVVKVSSGLASKNVSSNYGAFCFEFSDAGLLNTRSFGKLTRLDQFPDLITWQCSENFNGVDILFGDILDTEQIFVGRHSNNYANVALYSLVVFDHDTAEAERQVVIDYWKEEYPELFFDQAWTVTGLTNDSPGRASVKNLTGNGVDLILE